MLVAGGVRQRAQRQVEELGGVGLLGNAQGQLDLGGGAGRQPDATARAAGALL